MAGFGTALLDFGAHPGSDEATLDVTGQTGFIASSGVDAWIAPADTADHTIDEHRVEDIAVFAYYQADGTIRIHGHCPSADNLYGKFNVGWVWTN